VRQKVLKRYGVILKTVLAEGWSKGGAYEVTRGKAGRWYFRVGRRVRGRKGGAEEM